MHGDQPGNGMPAPSILPDDDLRGRSVTVEVRLAPGEPRRWRVHGVLFLPDGPQPATVQLLVPGLTYDHRYWTIPGEHNYAAHMVRAGYAVFALDRIGTGRSDRPAADQVTAQSNAEALHDVVQALRSGVGGAAPFERVVVVGHSFGSGVALVEAATYHDVDGLVVSGMLHTTAPLYEEVRAFFHMAGDDPVLAAAGVDYPENYATQRPGLRARMLEYPPAVRPELSRHNEAIKSTATLGEGESLPSTYEAAVSRAVDVPVLIVVGQHDALFSSADVSFAATSEAVHAFEKTFYAEGLDLETHVVPGAGHSLNVHDNAGEWFALARAWVDRVTAFETVG
jgi:pimeloyl-ACP methyl ester carboxylesterase